MSGNVRDYWLVPFAFIASFVALYWCALPLLDDPDVPWHLATGSLILETRGLPATDPWSFATAGQPWYILSWLWNVVLGGVQLIGGAHGAFLFAISLMACVVAFLTHRLWQQGVPDWTIIGVIAAATTSLYEMTNARPHTATFLILLAFHHLLWKSRRQPGFGKSWPLPLLMLLWVNIHGSFFVGFVLIGAHMAEAIYLKRYDWVRWLVSATFLCILAACINPYGPLVTFGVLRTLDSAIRPYILEWQPYTFGVSLGMSIWLVLFALAANLRLLNVPIADKLLAYAGFFAAMMAFRNNLLWVLIAAPYVAAGLAYQVETLRTPRKPNALLIWAQSEDPRRLWRFALAAWLGCVVAFSRIPYQERLQSPERSFKDAVEYALQHYPDHKFLGDYTFGGQIIYYGGGKLPYFMDSRAGTAYSESMIEDYLAFFNQATGWERKIAAYGIDGILASNQSSFAQAYESGAFHDHWKLVFAGERGNVYIAQPSVQHKE